MFLDYAWYQMALGYLDLFLHHIAWKRNDLHAVKEGPWYRGGGVGGGDKHDFAQIKWNFKKVVREVPVLFRVEHLQQRRRGVAAKIGAEFVDLVHQNQRVVRAALFYLLDYASRQRADIGAAVSAYLRLVVHPAKGYIDKLAPHGTRDRAAKGGLTHAGRPDEADDLRTHILSRPLFNGEVLQNAFFDILKTVMILFKHLTRVGQIQTVLCGIIPGQLHQRLYVGPRYGGLRRDGGQFSES